jgi:hypothetical protein
VQEVLAHALGRERGVALAQGGDDRDVLGMDRPQVAAAPDSRGAAEAHEVAQPADDGDQAAIPGGGQDDLVKARAWAMKAFSSPSSASVAMAPHSNMYRRTSSSMGDWPAITSWSWTR